MSWQRKKLDDVIEFLNGKKADLDESGNYVVYGSNGIIGKSSEYRYENAIIIGRVGAYCGSIAYCPDKFWASDNTIVAKPKDDGDVRFFSYFLHDFGLNKYAGGAAQPLVTQTVLKSLEGDIPDSTLQRKITSILSAYDDLIGNNTRRIAILEEMARRIYEEWFVRFRFPGHEQVKMVESEFGLIPEGWTAKHLGDLAREKRETIDPNTVDSSTPYVGLEHIPRRSIALMEWGEAKDVQSTKHIFKSGDILFGKIRPYFHKVSVAPVDGVCSSDAIVIEAKGNEMFPFVLGTVSSDDFVQHATQTSNGVKMPRANWDVLLKYPVFIPTEDLQKRFTDFIKPTLEQIKVSTFKIRNLRKTRDLLLPKLISGEVDVSHFPEPENI